MPGSLDRELALGACLRERSRKAPADDERLPAPRTPSDPR